jgi:hypothetical protein
MSDTPETDAQAYDVGGYQHEDGSIVLSAFARKLERQRDRLAEELDTLKQSILDLSHPNMKLLLEERKEAREQRDRLMECIEKGDALRFAVVDELVEQRDRLKEACKLLMRVIGDPTASAEDWWATEDEINAAWNSGSEALAAVKGGSDDN